ncbi:SubName: Full=Related to secreted protein-Streptomyces sp. SPB74 {ECO:0000313/EMBL:CCA73199.1} [Serendipita indica DSM 11827]|nr:SubName: Full=Related to secreted protein-Streptomyces sp. SPB74 {ECO:0000313/EMBL:CCA73199.1} [Serendipita indica DSM 11827]
MAGAYDAMLGDSLVAQSRTPSPHPVIGCGEDLNIGCVDETQDALAAYGNALAWYVSRDGKYAKKAISYFNAWAGTIQGHANSSAPLQTGFAGTSWAKGAEIIRHTYTGWGADDIAKFETMLRDVYLSRVIDGSSSGSQELVMMEATQSISVFLNDRASYDKAMNKYLGRIPAYIYLATDGAYWQGQIGFVNGIVQETCRDFAHTGYGIAAIGHIAETSRIQGTDLYVGEVGTRLRYALEFHSLYELGAAVPSWLCEGKLTLGLGPITEIGLNAMKTRLGYTMPTTQILTQMQRPASTTSLLGWETLTHAENPE